jgi:Tol biopolymer transport system component
MRKRVLGLCALAFCVACTEAGFRQAQLNLSIGTPKRIAGTGDLSEPRFASATGLFLTVTEAGQPSLVYLVTAPTLEVEPVSFRPPPEGTEDADLTAFGEFLRNLFILPEDASFGGSVTGTRRLAVFLSRADDLLEPGTEIFFFRETVQAFLKDLETGDNFLVSGDPDGLPCNADVTAASISSNGRFVVFATAATNLIRPVNGTPTANGSSQVYVYDLFTGLLQLVSRTPGGAPGNGNSMDPAITPDGRSVVFRSVADDLLPGDTNLTADIYLFDRTTVMMERISVDNAGGEAYLDAREPALSANGNFVVFSAVDAAVPAGPRQVFLRDRAALTTTMMSRPPGGAPGNGDSSGPCITPDAAVVAFASAASNLSTADTEGFMDVFAFDLAANTLARVSLDVSGIGGGNGDSWAPTLSPDSGFIGYLSRATNLVANDPDTNGLIDLILGPLP